MSPAIRLENYYALISLLLTLLMTTEALKNADTEAIPPSRSSYNQKVVDSCVPFLPLAGTRKCGRGCSSGFTCRNEKRRCLCDGVCGRSCVIASRPCVKPKLENGKIEVVPYNRFGAEAIYSCFNGYVLSGPNRRTCQGDGTWSDEDPRCEKEVMCTAPPVVRYSFHNGFPEDENARYSIGTQIRYTCLPGFQMFGFPKAMCLSGRWMGPRLVCSPRNCGDPGPLADGRQEGSIFYYGHSVVFICDSGFELIGDSFRKCQANGTWSGVQPRCTPIQCPVLHSPAYGNIVSQNNSVGGIVKTACQPGYLLQGDEERVCQRDRRWSGRRANCSKIECGEIGYLPNGRIVYTGSGLGAVAYFRCDPNAIPSPSGAALRSVCLREGKWSDEAPKCLSNCRLTFSPEGFLLVNATRPSPYQYTISEQVVHLGCNQSGYRLFPSISLLQCKNGSWYDTVNLQTPISTLPTCQPLSCTEPPPSIENGLIRWRPSTHGERAFYVCIPGYILNGNDSVTCLYGQWSPTGTALPICRESYCSYPGPLLNGDIIILGRFGLYEFTPEVSKLRHGEQIEFGCKPDYRLIGQRKATCVNGRWSPAFKPLCIQNSVYFNTNNNKSPASGEISDVGTAVSMVRSASSADKKTAVVAPTAVLPPAPSPAMKMLGLQLYRNRRNSYNAGFQINGEKKPGENPVTKNCEATLSAEYRRVESVSSSFKVIGEQSLQPELLLAQSLPPQQSQQPGDDEYGLQLETTTTTLPPSLEVTLTTNNDKEHQMTTAVASETVRINCPPGYRPIPPDGLATCIDGKWYPTVPSCISIRLSTGVVNSGENNSDNINAANNKKRAHSSSFKNNKHQQEPSFAALVASESGEIHRPMNSYYLNPYVDNSKNLASNNNNLFVVAASLSPFNRVGKDNRSG